jgi:DNA excision repair protein ERCC-6
VSILHSSGSGMLDLKNEDDSDIDRRSRSTQSKSSKAVKKIVNRVVNQGHVLVTTYNGLQTYAEDLLGIQWNYAVLDEGHKIRNPNADVTVTCKELNTPNRIILSGTPVQNNLSELWSLFDFIYPMRLGTLVNFRTQFEVPIRQGGYAGATNLQVMTAEKCAETLKETISQYLLQRLKVDVAADLPEKTEQVLFCKLAPAQLGAYERFLKSDEVTAILSRRRQSLYGIDILRKICNHPDLLDPMLKGKLGYDWGSPKKSGKLQVVGALLKMWKRFGHKTLLFSQGKLMLNIIEAYLRKSNGITFVRMDGETAIDQRQILIDRFNNDPDIDVFLLTTRTGGLGVNLTGADRIIIFDPDWNPSTDMQARERAWRLGQTKPVSIYRLMTSGTIEEKIYHRQIFKQFMTNKVLKDPKQRTAFDISDLYDLFTLGPGESTSDRPKIFEGAEVRFDKSEAVARTRVSRDHPAGRIMPISSASTSAQALAGEVENETQAVQKLDVVAAVEEFQEDPEANDEKRMIEGIFARSVDSAYEHEAIVGGKKQVKADQSMNRHEANKVAAEAARHLRQAGEQARNVTIGTVTWTGEVGQTGRPGAARRGQRGLGSAAVMAGLASRQGLDTTVSAGSSRSATPLGERNLKAKDFIVMIQAFIKRHNGQVPSRMLVDHFNPYCPTTRQSEEFKTALDQIATLTKSGSTGRGIWSLKPGY